jgi:hypothetical protein
MLNVLDLSAARSASQGEEGASAQALRDLNLDDPSFASPASSPASSPAARRRSWGDSKRGATSNKKTPKGDGVARGQLTLREQEKVGFSFSGGHTGC